MSLTTDITRTDLAEPLPLARALVRRASVTPRDDGALDVLQQSLETLGFACARHRFGEVDNLYARRGSGGPNLCFAGHTDVVPPGKEAVWRAPPFAGDIVEDALWARGAADMKGGIAAFIAAVARLDATGGRTPSSVSLLITGDEEGPAVDGTKKLLPAIAAAGEHLDHCIVGEPTSQERIGDTIKIGRRGSLNGVVHARGRQGHVAYPERACNPLPTLLDFLHRLRARKLDDGAPSFQPSNLEISSIDVGNPAHNVIPADATARFNIRFNIAHQGAELQGWIGDEARAAAGEGPTALELDLAVMGEAFLTEPGAFTNLLQDAAEAVCGARPALSTGGGTSDARFIKDYAPVAEIGLLGATIHRVDEHVPLADLETLTAIYAEILNRYAASPPG